MKSVLNRSLIATMFVVLLGFGFAENGQAEKASISDVPLANSPSDAVLPNLMYILDDSGSMMWDYMPDNVQALTDRTTMNNCKACSSSTASSCTTHAMQCSLGNPGNDGIASSNDSNTADWGEPPYFASQFNQIYYNPDITYAPAITSAGVSLGNQSPTAAQKDAFLNTGTTIDLTANYPDIYYCTSSGTTQFTGQISNSNSNTGKSYNQLNDGTVLVVSGISGSIAIGQLVGVPGVALGTVITSQISGTTNGNGVYRINISQRFASTNMWAASATQLAATAGCRRNGKNNLQTAPLNYFLYASNNATTGTNALGAYPVATGTASTSFVYQIAAPTGAAHYFTITANEYCSDSNLVNCALANADGTAPSGFSIPAPIRYCGTTGNAAALTAVSDAAGSTTSKCRKKFDVNNYPYPRYGRFQRVDIVSTTATYTKNATSVRTDCAAAASCTYAEEIQNFANWYSYYRARMAMMKTATGRAFLPIDDRYRVGFITINPGSGSNGAVDSTHPVQTSKYLPLGTYDATQKSSFYSKLYAQANNGGTPLRQALSRVGRHYANITTGINNGMSTDPISYSCQQNFSLLTTDGYWNDNDSDAVKPNNTGIGNQDNTPNTTDPFYVARKNVTLDGLGTNFTNVQPKTTLEQTICSASNSTAFPSGTQTSCGCAAGQKRIKQRTVVQTTTTTGTDGVQSGSNTTTDSTTFQDITACNSLVSTAVTPTTIREQQKVVANALTTFGSINGVTAGMNANGTCGVGKENAIQRTTIYNTTVVTTDGVAAAPVISGTTYAFASAPGAYGTCVSPLTQTAVTPTTITEEQVVVGTANSTFAAINGVTAGANAVGTCGAGLKRVKRRTTTYNTTVTTTDGVVGGPVISGTSYAFTDIGSCVAPKVDTSTVTTTIDEEQVVVGNATSTFAIINGVTAGANGTVSCTAPQRRIKHRKTVYTTTTTTTDGVAAAPVTAGTTYTLSNVGSGCVNQLIVTATTPTTETEQQVCTNNNNTTFGAAASGTTGEVACGCTTGRSALRQRVIGYTKTVVTTDGVAAAPTYTSITGPGYSTPIACSTAAKSVAISPNPTISGTTGTSSNSGTTLVPAATTTGNVTTTGSSGGPTPVPAATTTVGGATVNNTTGGPTPVPAATTTTIGATVTTNNSGTTITAANITINPNPTITPGIVNTTEVPGGTPNTLADVAMYYYKTDLRTTGTVAPNNVPTTDKDIAPHQHMVTFTLGMGLQGLMDYSSNYESSLTGDFAKIKNGSTGCSWSLSATTVCNWPAPSSGTPTTLDDLWHAAVNGRGIYYSASDPNTLADGLAGALSALKVQTAAASASATSSPNITQTDNFIYSSTFRTVKWDGEIVAQRIDTSNGNVLPAIAWSAQALLDAQVSTTSDTRNIWTFSSASSTKLKAFTWGNLTATEQASFNGKCTALSQCALLTQTQKDSANDGQNMVNFLRGQTSNESTLYRDREHVLGDPVNATPSFVKSPRFNFNDTVSPAYGTFKAANATRQGVLYIASNDGMLHAFNGDTGQEMWAYIPRMVMPVLYNLATDNWDIKHIFIVDGSPQIMDVYDSSASAWKTILIAGLNKGGQGYYALDITDPANPKGMWEICSDPSWCAVSDADMGLTFGYPVITKRATDGKWVALVTSGLNNIVPPATGRGYLYVLDAFTGAILQKVDTGAGDTTTPSGLAKISGFANNFNVDNTATYIYGGDLLGNVWRFDMTVNPPAVFKLAMLTDAGGKPQSITTRPELAVISGYRVVYIGTGRYLGEDDLVDPATLSPALPWAYQQSLYAIKDRNVANGNIRSATPGLVQQSIIDNGGTTRTTTSATVDWATKDGWYVDFNPSNSSPGERVNLDPQLDLGTLVVATNVPNNSACTVGGDSWLYQFDYKAGTYIASASGAIAAQKFTGQTLVGIVVVRLPNGVLKAIATGATGVKTPVGVNIGGGGSSGRRVSWRELIQ